jgi:hypothetical protein
VSDRSFEQIWRSVLLYAPDLPLPLAQRFVNIAYARTLRANQWSQLKGYSEWYLPAPYTTGTVSVTNGSTTVTGAATVWTSAMVGRQIMMATQGVPWYDIVAVDTGAQTLTLDRAYSGPDLSGEEYEISQVYISAPTDHDYFTSILDPTREWKLHFDVDQKTIDAWDPKRLKVGDVWVVAAVGPDPLAVAGTPENRFEIWPRAGDTRRLPFRYQKRAPLLSASADRPIWPIKSDVLEEGALARLAMYKGTADAPNPYFDLNLYRFHEENYRRELHRAQMEDQRVDQTWVQYAATEDWPFAPIDGAYLQSHDISPMTRWGYGYWV